MKKVVNHYIKNFVSDIIRLENTTNEEYYGLEAYLMENLALKNHLTEQILQNANQLMWLNLSLERGNLTSLARENIKLKKDKLLDWFRTQEGNLGE